MFTEATLRQLWPHVDEAKPGLIEAVIVSAATVFPKYGLTTPLLVAHAMAQFSEEFGADLPASKIEFEENLNYTAARLVAVWPKHFSNQATAMPYAHNPQKLANYIYEPPVHTDLGNRANSNDGWLYRGQGGSQITGYDGFLAVAKKTGLDLIGHPDLVNDTAHFLECAVADFIICGCLPFAANDDVRGVTHHLNGGYNGLDERERWLQRWKIAMAAPDAPAHAPGTLQYGDTGTDVKTIQQALIDKGYHLGGADGDYGDKTRASVLAFQGTEGLPTTGIVDQATKDALDSAPPRPVDEDVAKATADDLRQGGSKTVANADNVNNIGKTAVAVGTGGAAVQQTGVFDQVQGWVDKAGQIKTFVNFAEDATKFVGQHWWVAVAGVGGSLWYFGNKIISARLGDHQSGANLGR